MTRWTVNYEPGFTEEEAFRLYRTHYDSFSSLADAKPRVVNGPAGERLRDAWRSLKSYTIEDRHLFDCNRSRLRTFFWALRPVRFFRSLNPKVEAVHDGEYDRTIFDRFGNPRAVRVKRHYELLSINAADIGTDSNSGRIYALEVTCPTSGSKFMIMLEGGFDRTSDPDTKIGQALGYIFNGQMVSHRHGDVVFRPSHDEDVRMQEAGFTELFHGVRSTGSRSASDILSQILTEA